MNRDLFLAILSMDSYNRGYGVGIRGLDPFGSIGNAEIDTDSLILGGAPSERVDANSGFYAIAYDMTGVAGFADGERVISYRGTDEGRWTDILNGYLTGGGWPFSVQAGQAIDFARAVIGEDTNPVSVNNVTVTGHSLGAGLAGYVAGLYGWEGFLMDPMPYRLATVAAFAAATPGLQSSRIYGSIVPTQLPEFDEISGFYLPAEGENPLTSVVASLRGLPPFLASGLGLDDLSLPTRNSGDTILIRHSVTL